MRHFYRFRIENMPLKNKVLKGIEDYVNTSEFKCFNPENLHLLHITTKIPKIDLLRNIFIAFLRIEHRVRKRLFKDYDADSKKVFTGFCKRYHEEILPVYEKLPKPQIDPTAYSYPRLLNDEGKPNRGLGIYGVMLSLGILHHEDNIFLHKQKDEYLSYLRNGEINWDTNFMFEKDENDILSVSHSVVILLNDSYEYIGHIYTWSPLVMGINTWSPSINTLKFGGIRTSLKNTFFKTEDKIAHTFLNIISNIAKQEDWEYIEVAFNPIGAMPDILKSYNFVLNSQGIPRHIKTDDIKCLGMNKHIIIEEESKVDIPKDRSDIYKVLKKTYPNREINKSIISRVNDIMTIYRKEFS